MEMEGLDAFTTRDGYRRPQVEIIRPEDVKVRISSLTWAIFGICCPTCQSACTTCWARPIISYNVSLDRSGR